MPSSSSSSSLQPFGRRCIFYGQNGPGNIKKAGVMTLGADSDRAQKKLTKFKESAWKCVYYSAAEIFALAITYNEPWFTDSKMFWLGSGEQRWPNLMTRFGDLTLSDVLIFQSDNEVPVLEELGVLTL